MFRYELLWLSLAIVLVGCAHRTGAETAAAVRQVGPDGGPLPSGPDFTAVDAHLTGVYERTPGRGGGLAVLLADREGLLYRRELGGFGAQRVIPLASASKLLSAATIMTVVDEGLLDLDAPISRYLRSVPEDKADITLRQLLSHTSGLHGPVHSRVAMNRSRTELGDVAHDILRLPLAAEPGRVFGYGEASLQVAGAVAEAVTGSGWHQLFLERIAGPLGMTGTAYGEGFPFLGSSVRSSAGEYLAFLRMLQAGGVHEGRRILSEQAVDELLREQTAGVDMSANPYGSYVSLLGPDFRMSYALGNWVERVATDGRAIDNSSAGIFGFVPWIDRQTGTVGVFAYLGNMTDVALPYFEMKRLIRQALRSRDAP